jgi:hypothetical protein
MNHVHRLFWCVSTAFSAAALSACASVNSMPDPVLTVAATKPVTLAYPGTGYPRDVTNPADRKAYRNDLIHNYLTAADARYLAFLRALSRQSKVSNIGFDVATLGLSGLASMISSAATELAAGAEFVTGTHSTVSKELYYDKTFTAITTAMEARRLQVRSEIELHLKQDDVDTYTLGDGFADVMRYQMATTIDGAVEDLTAAAAQQRAAAAERYKNAVEACSAPAGLPPIWRNLNLGLRKPEVTRDQLDAIAKQVGAEKNEKTDEQIGAIMEAVEKDCTANTANAALALLPGGK